MREISYGNFELEKMGKIPQNEIVKIFDLENNFNWNGYNTTEMQKLYCLIDLLRLYEEEKCDEETYDKNNIKFDLYEILKKMIKTKNNVDLYISKVDPHLFADEENSVLEILNMNEDLTEDEIISLFENIIFNQNICIVHTDDLYSHRIEIKEINKNTYKKIPLNTTIDVDDDFYTHINENGYNQFEMEKLSCIVDLIRLFKYDVCDIHEENDEPIDSRDIKIVKKLYRCLNKAVQEETNSNLQFDYQSDFRYMDDYNDNIFDILDFNSSDDEDEIVKHFKNIIFNDNFYILYEDVV